MKKSSADKFSDSSAVVLMLIIGATLNPAGLRTYGEESTSTASAPANERTPAPASAIDATIFERPNLTGDWLGARDTLSSHGLTLEISLTQFYQGVVDGGNERDFEYGGKVDYYVNLDGGKAGLWPGFSITTHIETRYGNDVNEIDGMFSLANFNMAFPKGEHAVTGVTALKLTQRLFDHLLLIAGKINTLDDFRLNYTGGNGLDRFMNSAVVANVINGRTIPYSTYGAGFAMFADQGPEFTFLVRDPDHHPTTTDLDKLFAHGALLTGSLRLPVAPFGLPGTQVFGGNWSSRHYTSLDPSDWENVPGQGLPALPSREHDTVGVAYFHIGVSDEVKDLLASQPGIAQRDEQGVELYYNAALSPWCHLTADLQVAQPSTKAFDTAVLAGSRLKIDF